jgi:small GTP-binding protein
VLVVGDVATGKTSLIRRYVRNDFSNEYKTTVGVDFSLKVVVADDTKMSVQLWDIAGQERFCGLSRLFYTHACGAVVVFDMYDRKSFESTIRWKEDIDQKVFLPDGSGIPVLLLANKADLLEDGTGDIDLLIPEEEIAAMCEERGFLDYRLVSAKTGESVDDACL